MAFLKKLILVAALGVSVPVLASETTATLYKNPNCGCCEYYAKYLEKNGFKVTVIPTNDLVSMQQENGVPPQLAGCHTTKIGNYTFEGHIPVESIKRFLSAKPMAKGLAVPGMPAGSPGMGGTKQEPLKVYYISDANPPKVYDTH